MSDRIGRRKFLIQSTGAFTSAAIYKKMDDSLSATAAKEDEYECKYNDSIRLN